MKYRFKLLGGSHDQGDGRVYSQGDEFESAVELDVLHGANKFQRLSGSFGQATLIESESVLPTERSGLDGMTLTELKVVADQEEIDLGDAKTKRDVLRVVKAAFEEV
jgi:hypothetical protein